MSKAERIAAVPGTTALLRSLLAAAEPGENLPPVVADSMIPERIASGLLPWQAYGFSVDAWDDEWPDEVKRAAIRQSFAYHRLKGTMAGLRWAARLGGGEIVHAVNPPSKFFASKTLTEDEYREFLSIFPELRLYPFRGLGRRYEAAPGVSVGMWGRGMFAGRFAFPLKSTAALRLTPRSTIFDRGVETELTTLVSEWDWREVTTEQRVEVRQPGRATRQTILGPFFRFAPKSTAGDRIYTLRTSETLVVPGQERLAVRTVRPSLETISTKAENVAIRGTARGVFGRGFFPSSGARAAPLQSTAYDRIFKRMWLFDPEREGLRKRRPFGQQSRLGIAPFTSELTVRIPSKTSPLIFGRFCRGFASSHDSAKFDGVVKLLRGAKRASTKVLMSTKTVQPITAGESLIAGEALAGQLKEIV